jgi:hypothetical protein
LNPPWLLVLDYIPVLEKNAVLDAKEVAYDPVTGMAPEYRPWTITKSPALATLRFFYRLQVNASNVPF